MLSGFLGAIVGGSFALGAVFLEHALRARAQQKRTLNSVLLEIGQVRRTIVRWLELLDGDPSWRNGGPGIRPHLVVGERLPVEVSELPTHVTRQIEAVELKLRRLYDAAAEAYARTRSGEGLASEKSDADGLSHCKKLAEHAVSAIKSAEQACTTQWDAWRVPFWKREITLNRAETNYQGPRRLEGFDPD